jgi:Ca2+:H+ antiporter
VGVSWLLVFSPLDVLLEHVASERSLWVFGASALAIVLLAGWMGRATEALVERSGEGVGGFLGERRLLSRSENLGS